jgi:hypothetical protein
MNTHLKVVAVLHFVLGAFGLIGALVIFAIFGAGAGITLWQGEHGVSALIAFVAMCIGGLIGLKALPDIIGAWALLAGKSWARLLMMFLGFLDLLHFPIGTAIGVYTLWVLFREDLAQPATPQMAHPSEPVPAPYQSHP